MTINNSARPENRIFEFRKVAVCLQFVDADGSQPRAAAISAESDDVFRSYQLDMLSHRFQKRPPMYSRRHSDPLPVVIHFPRSYTYTSEGRRESLISSRTEVHASAKLSFTHFYASGIRIWHLALTPGDDGYFTEYDLIRLIKLYHWRQESTDLHERIRFSIAGGDEALVNDFLDAHYAEPSLEKTELQAGTVAIDWEYFKDRFWGTDFLKRLDQAASGDKDACRAIHTLYDDDARKQVLKVLCGIVTGIFDFDRMDEEEMIDTLIPTWSTGTGFTHIHRGTMTTVGDGDEVFDRSWPVIGISPYPIILHSLLLHNDKVLDMARCGLDEVLLSENDGKIKPKNRRDALRAVETLVRVHYLPNVFQYDTERQLYSRSMKTRGSAEEWSAVRYRVKELHSRVAADDERKSQQANALLGVLVGGVSLMAIKPIISDMVNDLAFHFPGLSGLSWVIFLLVVIISACIGILWWKFWVK